MKKIMMNDACGLTQATLDKIKTNTRRIDKEFNSFYGTLGYNRFIIKPNGVVELWNDKSNTFLEFKSRYRIGDKVAIAQRYCDCIDKDRIVIEKGVNKRAVETKGWNNKMFVKASLMPHHIEITNIRLERLQEISDEDCIAEGIINMYQKSQRYSFKQNGKYYCFYDTCKGAYKDLIDKISGKGTWESNPFVFVYEFKLID